MIEKLVVVLSLIIGALTVYPLNSWVWGIIGAAEITFGLSLGVAIARGKLEG